MANGGVIAPVGMNMVALAAQRHAVPFVVVAGSHKVDFCTLPPKFCNLSSEIRIRVYIYILLLFLMYTCVHNLMFNTLMVHSPAISPLVILSLFNKEKVDLQHL
jgi:hypothetical protein